MNDIPLPSLVRFGLEGTREHNLAMAKEHLSQAGYPDGIDLTLTLADMQDWITWCPVWQQQLAEAGINVELDVTPADTYWGDQWLSAPFAMTGWNVRTVDHGLGLWYLSDADWNETHWASEEFDSDLASARATTDEAERTRLYAQAAAADRRRGRPLRADHVRLLQCPARRRDRLAAPRGVLHHRRPLTARIVGAGGQNRREVQRGRADRERSERGADALARAARERSERERESSVWFNADMRLALKAARSLSGRPFAGTGSA